MSNQTAFYEQMSLNRVEKGSSMFTARKEARTDADRQHLGVLERVNFRPVFIMGSHRSGTTLLHKTLGATQCFNVVTAYHIIKYGEIVHNHLNGATDERKADLAALFEQKGLRNRGIDGIEVSPDAPVEYGFALRGEGYRPRLKPSNLESFIELCKKVQLTSDPDRPLLLKNPLDSLNFMFVKEVFPDSRFIFIHRNPVNTINSQLRSIRSMLSARNEYGAMLMNWYSDIFGQPIRLRLARFMFSSRFGLGVRLMTRGAAKATNYFMENISSLSESDYISLRYEDLCREPRSSIAKILDHLDLEGNAQVDYESLISVRADALLKDVESSRASIIKRMRPYFERFGYER